MMGVLFGSIGVGYLLYGKKQRRGAALLSGALLCSFTYFVPNLLLIIIIGVILMALPFVVKF